MKRISTFEQIALLIAAIGDSSFHRTFASIIHNIAHSDSIIIFLYGKHSPPQILFKRFIYSLKRNSLNNYVEGFYLLDPFYIAAIEDNRRGLVRIESIEPSGFRSSEYYRHYYKYSHVDDEINFIFRISSNAIFVASAQRAEGKGRYSPHEISALTDLEATLRSAAEAHWRWSISSPASEREKKANHQRFKQMIYEFGREILTPREHEIVQLILKGFSTAEISRLHKISEDTVKVHRRNIYEKLRISSLSELFGLIVHALEDGGKI